MTAATIIRKAQFDGVNLILSPAGTIKATGDGESVKRWQAAIREHKAAIIDVLKVGAGDTREPLNAAQETAIRARLAAIGETDPAIIAEVIQRCRQDVDARAYFTGRAAAELPNPDPFPDGRRTFDPCADRRCQAAKRGEIVASRNYEPIRDQPRRCEGCTSGMVAVSK